MEKHKRIAHFANEKLYCESILIDFFTCMLLVLFEVFRTAKLAGSLSCSRRPVTPNAMRISNLESCSFAGLFCFETGRYVPNSNRYLSIQFFFSKLSSDKRIQDQQEGNNSKSFLSPKCISAMSKMTLHFHVLSHFIELIFRHVWLKSILSLATQLFQTTHNLLCYHLAGQWHNQPASYRCNPLANLNSECSRIS